VTSDGRSAVRVRHRRAILDAAVALIQAGEGARFTADELAVRAGVSRRTVFNHFASLDDVLLAVCSETLDVVAEQVRVFPGPAGAGEDSRAAMFTALSHALRAAELSGPVLQVWQALGGPLVDAQRTGAFAQHALALVAEGLTTQLSERFPDADPLDVALLASLLAHGLGVIAGHWVSAAVPGQPPDPAEWDHLLERLLDTVGSGYLPAPGPGYLPASRADRADPRPMPTEPQGGNDRG
jgi:AcrR family transcriptional regulator